MNKKNITFIMAGIIIQILQFIVRIGDIRIDIFSDILAYLLILIGILPLAGRSKLFKKSRRMAITALVFSILMQALNCMDFGDAANDLDMFTNGIATIFSIYFTYYFTESIVFEAKIQEKAALTRNLRFIWAIFGSLIFISYIAFVSSISVLSIITQAVTILTAVYYVSSINGICTQLCPDTSQEADN